jgi:hypothetical protein
MLHLDHCMCEQMMQEASTIFCTNIELIKKVLHPQCA